MDGTLDFSTYLDLFPNDSDGNFLIFVLVWDQNKAGHSHQSHVVYVSWRDF